MNKKFTIKGYQDNYYRDDCDFGSYQEHNHYSLKSKDRKYNKLKIDKFLHTTKYKSGNVYFQINKC